MERPRHQQAGLLDRLPPRWIALGIYFLATVVFFATASRALLASHTPFNHFALLADAWLHGRLDLGGPPPAYTGNNDFALHDDRWFISFPPFPALLIAPLVKLAGSAERTRDAVHCGNVGPLKHASFPR